MIERVARQAQHLLLHIEGLPFSDAEVRGAVGMAYEMVRSEGDPSELDCHTFALAKNLTLGVLLSPLP